MTRPKHAIASRAGVSAERREAERAAKGSPSENLAEAVRELIRESVGEPAKQAPTRPTLRGVLWVSIAVANTLLLITQLPESFLKNTSFEFASKLVGYIFGGVLLLYSSWLREQLTVLLNVRWFQLMQLALLTGLVALRAPFFAIHPRLTPLQSRVFVNGQPIRVRGGNPIRLPLGNHAIRIAAPQGEPNLADGTPMRDQEFTITWTELIDHVRRTYVPYWTPLYPVAIVSEDDNLAIALQRREDPLRPEILDSQLHPDIGFDSDARLLVRLNGGANLFLPLGTYSIAEVRASVTCKGADYVVEEKANSISVRPQPCSP